MNDEHTSAALKIYKIYEIGSILGVYLLRTVCL